MGIKGTAIMIDKNILGRIEKLEMDAKLLSVNIDLLRKRLEKVNFEENKYKRWRAEGEVKYYCLGRGGGIEQYIDSKHIVDNFLYSIGNYFQTKEESEEYKENLITKQKLKDLALRLNKGVEIDWKNIQQTKYSLYLDCNEYLGGSLGIVKSPGQIYCLDKDFLKIAKEEIGEEALIKLIKSGV